MVVSLDLQSSVSTASFGWLSASTPGMLGYICNKSLLHKMWNEKFKNFSQKGAKKMLFNTFSCIISNFSIFYKYSRDILIEMFYISVAYIIKDCYEFLDLIEKVIIRAREMVQW